LNETLIHCEQFQFADSMLFGQVKCRKQFFRALTLSKYFSGKRGSAPLRKIGLYAYGYKRIHSVLTAVYLTDRVGLIGYIAAAVSDRTLSVSWIQCLPYSRPSC